MVRPAAAEEDTAVHRTGSVSHIGNKAKRQEQYGKYRREKAKQKLRRRLELAKEERKSSEGKKKRQERVAKNKPRTIEGTRVYNPTVLHAPNTHEQPAWMGGATGAVDESMNEEASEASEDDDEGESESGEDERESGEDERESGEDERESGDAEQDADEDAGADEQAAEAEAEPPLADPRQLKYDADDDPEAPPSILITTSLPSNATSPHLTSANARSHPAQRVREFVHELLNVFPGAEYRARRKAQGAGLGKICGWARARRYDMVVVIGEANKKPVTLTLVQLPLGPTALFRLTSVALGKEVYAHARPTPHTPELILNNFTTALGHRVGSMLQHMFPKVPQLEGRQVVTAHNQRDYVFFRRHRYEFASKDKAALQEIGPRFTLKLVSLSSGLPKGAGAWDGRFVEELEEQGADRAEKHDATSAPDDDTDGIEFKWKPKMGASRRNFYL